MTDRTAPTITSEPEREIHSDELSSATPGGTKVYSFQISHLYSSLRSKDDVSRVLTRERQIHLTPDLERNGMFDKVAQSWSDDSSFRLEDIDDALFESISAIREQASSMDAVLAYNQLETLQQELAKAKRELLSKDEHIGELCQLVQLKDKRIATLELERDLFRASSQQRDHKTSATNNRHIHPPSTLLQDDIVEECKQPFGTPGVAILTPILLAPSKNTSGLKVVLPRSQSTIPNASIANGSVVSDISSDWPQLTNGITEQAQKRPKKSTRYRLGSLRKPEKSVLPDLKNSCTLQSYIESLQHKLDTSVQTADELRKRLSMVNRYYEHLVRQLHQKMEKMEADRNRMQADLVDQIRGLQRANQAAFGKVEIVPHYENKDETKRAA